MTKARRLGSLEAGKPGGQEAERLRIGEDKKWKRSDDAIDQFGLIL
jgi:hypothetical protein